jgi:S-(hydroxymethyl)glutathione synthase
LPAHPAGGILVCKRTDRPVKGNGDVVHNRACCGCIKCGKPPGATFSVVAVAPRDNVTVTENGDNPAQGLRYAYVWSD